MVDVQWTRRKNVRRARGAAAGTVLVKRFETVRVRPAAPHPLGDKAIDGDDDIKRYTQRITPDLQILLFKNMQ
jgi:hypothetical protein